MRPGKRFWLLAAALSTLLVTGWLFREKLTSFQWDVFFGTLRTLDWTWMTLALSLILATYFGRALRWEVMLRPICPKPNLWRIFKATAIGFTAVVLFGRAGELVRPYLIATKEKVPFSSQMAAWLLERIFDLLMVLLLFGAALTQVGGGTVAAGSKLALALDIGGWLAAIAAGAAILVLLGFRHFRESAQQRLIDALAFLPAAPLKRIETLIRSFASGMEATRDNRFTLRMLAYTLVEWMLVAAAFLAVFRAFPATARMGFVDVLVFMGFVSFGSAIQIPGIGGGMQVAAVVVLTELFGFSVEASSGMALVIWATSFAVIVPFGVALALHDGIRLGSLRHIEELPPPA